ncbi:uncharacterized protein LOC142587850 [Dermacentor variabilis]|uniref:uncharacterized protein LOC142587850 n=1 Tax=Dermacentor variabilis TaxID=34621 RepID=UPI003F5BFF21
MTPCYIVFGFLLHVTLICTTTGRIVRKGNELWYDQDCKMPKCVGGQRLVCPTKDTCSCFCKDVPCVVPRCCSGQKSTCLTKAGWCECKCIPDKQHCSDPWGSYCPVYNGFKLAVCVGNRPCKCNCAGYYNQHEKRDYKYL